MAKFLVYNVISILTSDIEDGGNKCENTASDTTVWCGATGVRYSDDFRDVIYKINPNNLACVYKKMFEASAVDNLRGIEIDETYDDRTEKKIETKHTKDDSTQWTSSTLKSTNGKYKFDSPPPHRGHSQIIRSVSSAYSNLLEKDKTVIKKEFRGWDVCSRPHSAESSGYQKFTITETRDIMKKRSQSASAKLAMKRDKLKLHKTVIGFHPRGNISGLRSTMSTPSQEHVTTPLPREKPDRQMYSINTGSSGMCPNHNANMASSFDQIQCEFEHFNHTKDHMRKYREEYTYRKQDLLMAPTGTTTYPMNVPSSCVPVTLPVFQWSDKTERITSRIGTPTPIPQTPTGLASPDNNIDEIRLNIRKSPIKKKNPKSNTPDVPKKSPHFLLAQNGVLKMEFYTNPMTFDDNDSVQSPVVCRSRPTIPSNAHGTIYPSSTDTHSYVVRRHTDI